MGSALRYSDQPCRSPWIAQLDEDEPPRPLVADCSVDVVVAGAGIAGAATAFYILRDTALSILLIDRDRVARGATGHNAGQLTTYFERPLVAIAEEFGAELAAAAQRDIEGAHDLLDTMAAEAAATVRIERFTGHMGMFNLNHLQVHLGGNLIRQQGGLPLLACEVSEEAEFLADIPTEFSGLYTVVPQARIRELLEISDDGYRAVLSDLAGCANSCALTQQVVGYLQRWQDRRFQFADCTNVRSVVVGDDGVTVHAGRHRVTAGHVVLCTNGYLDHEVRDKAGSPVSLRTDQRIFGDVAYMTAFVEEERRPPAATSYIRNPVIGGDRAYIYVTRRSYERTGDTVTLTCLGGPEAPFPAPTYDRSVPFSGDLLSAFDTQVRPLAQPARPAGQPYDFHWHGVMGYNESGIRVVGPHQQWPRLLYNLGCNGVGFLSSIFGGRQVARFLAGQELPPSIFSPR